MTQRYLLNLPEQEMDITLKSTNFHLRFYSFRNLTYVDIHRGQVPMCLGKRVMANWWLFPEYISHTYGNVRFETYKSDGDDYVWYEGFNTKFRLMAYSVSDMEQLDMSAEDIE